MPPAPTPPRRQGGNSAPAIDHVNQPSVANAASSEPVIVVIMGVSGSGKSSLGVALARAQGWDFLEGDDLHPPANLAKMRAGIALDEADRAPWLAAIAAWIARQRRAGRPGVVACSALRHRYRDRLRQAGGRLRFVYLQVARDELVRRLHARTHFMPPALLDSQLATLEPPTPAEQALYVPGSASIEAALAQVRRWLAAG